MPVLSEKILKSPGCSKIGLFQDLDEENRNRILSHSGWNEKHVEAGSIIHMPMELMLSLILIIHGRAEGSIISENGRQLRLGNLKAPALIAPALVFGNSPGALHIRAETECRVLLLKRNHLFELFREYPKLLSNYLEACADRFLYISRKLEILGSHSIRKKLAYYLLDLYEEYGRLFELPMSMTALAEFVAAERPSVSTVFHRMRQEGLFKQEGPNILIENPDFLSQELKQE